MQQFTLPERALSLVTTLRPGEGRAALQLCAQSFALMFAYYLLKVIREPMILADGSAELKAYSTALQAFLLMLIVPVFARLYRRLGNRREKHHIFRNTLLFFMGNLALFALAYRAGMAVAIAFYVWLGIFSVMTLALFWAFAADLYNFKSGQRMFPLIAAAASLGALAGSATAGGLDYRLGHDGVMWAAAALLWIPWWLSAATERLIPPGSDAISVDRRSDLAYGPLEGFEIVLRSGYLALIALSVIVLNLINTNGEYILASLVTEWARDRAGDDPRAGASAAIALFYSQYFFITTLLGFLVQLFLVARIFDRWGIAAALQVLPVLMIVNYSLLALFPLLVVARVALIAENSVNYSLQNTTRNALFLPVTREEKYIGKHTIETFAFRLGDVMSGGFVYLASAVVGVSLVGFILVNGLLACLLLLLSRAIGSGHAATAAENLTNLPPVASAPLPDVYIPAGELSELQLDRDTFVDPDAGDALVYEAFAGHTGRLPEWVRFDGLDRSFRFTPPPGARGSVRVRVVARDFDGLEAETGFCVHYGKKRVPQR